MTLYVPGVIKATEYLTKSCGYNLDIRAFGNGRKKKRTRHVTKGFF